MNFLVADVDFYALRIVSTGQMRPLKGRWQCLLCGFLLTEVFDVMPHQTGKIEVCLYLLERLKGQR